MSILIYNVSYSPEFILYLINYFSSLIIFISLLELNKLLLLIYDIMKQIEIDIAREGERESTSTYMAGINENCNMQQLAKKKR